MTSPRAYYGAKKPPLQVDMQVPELTLTSFRLHETQAVTTAGKFRGHKVAVITLPSLSSMPADPLPNYAENEKVIFKIGATKIVYVVSNLKEAEDWYGQIRSECKDTEIWSDCEGTLFEQLGLRYATSAMVIIDNVIRWITEIESPGETFFEICIDGVYNYLKFINKLEIRAAQTFICNNSEKFEEVKRNNDFVSWEVILQDVDFAENNSSSRKNSLGDKCLSPRKNSSDNSGSSSLKSSCDERGMLSRMPSQDQQMPSRKSSQEVVVKFTHDSIRCNKSLPTTIEGIKTTVEPSPSGQDLVAIFTSIKLSNELKRSRANT